LPPCPVLHKFPACSRRQKEKGKFKLKLPEYFL
jgi:hypothetical protein